MKGNPLALEILRLALPSLTAALVLARNLSASSVELPSGIVLDSTQQQLKAIKNQPGVLYGAENTEMLSPADVSVSLTDQLGGGALCARAEHLARIFGPVGAMQSPTAPEHLFVRKCSCT
jgi:hypothetical protein